MPDCNAVRKKKKFKPMVSKLESEVGKILVSLRYKHSAQYPIYSKRKRLRGVFDFYLTAHNTAIEVNGTYWHSDPRVYKNGPVYKSQKRAMRSWNKKVKHAKSLGIDIIVLWEKDLTEAEDMRQYVKDTLKDKL